MIIKCINDCEGDFWHIEIGKVYEVIKFEPECLMYITDGKRVTEPRYTIIDSSGNAYQYPVTCFEVVKTDTEIRLTDAEEYILRLQDAIEQLVGYMVSEGYYKGANVAILYEYLILAYRNEGFIN